MSEFLTVTEYNCKKLKHVDGTMVEFKAYGMEISAVSILGYDKFRRFFPQPTDSVIQLQQKIEVDFLIGPGKVSIYPDNTVRAKGGSDILQIR